MLRRACLVVAAAVLAAAGARAEVDVQVPASFKAKGSLDGETDVFRFFAPEGAVLSLKLVALRGAPLDFDVQLFDPFDTPVVADEIVDGGFRVQWKGALLFPTGEFRLEVSATGTGDYALVVKCKAERLFISFLDLPLDGTDTGEFSAFAGSRARFFSAPAEGSPAVPELTAVNTPSGGVLPLVETVRGTDHLASAGPFAEGGDFEVVVHNGGDAGLAGVLTLVKPPKAKPRRLDLRRSILGRPGGGETFVSRVVDGDGGMVSVMDSGSDLFGASVAVPAGALDAALPISLSSAVDPVPDDEDDQAAGPGVDLSPGGTFFALPVTVVLPYDLARIPADRTPQDLQVLIVEEDGTTSTVPPSAVDEVAETVSVETSTFSICIPIVDSGPPRLGIDPGGDEYWFLQFGATFFPDAGGDSRGRQFHQGMGEVSFFSDGTMQYSQERNGFEWQNQDSGGSPPIFSDLTQFVESDGATLDWAYSADGTRILLSGAPESLPEFRVSRDGRYMAGRHEDSSEPSSEVQFIVRKETGPLGPADLNGTWNLVFLELGADQSASTGAATPEPARGTGTFTFDGAGNCVVSVTQRRAQFNDATGNTAQPLESFTVAATYAIDDATVPGTILVTLPPEDEDPGTVLRLHPGAGLDVMLGIHTPAAGNEALGIVLMRQGTDLGPASLSGEYHGAEFSLDMQSYSPGASGLDISDFTTEDQGVVVDFDGTSSATVSFDIHEVFRDGFQADGIAVEDYPLGFPISVALTKQGKLTLAAGGGKVQGCAAPGGQVLAVVHDMGDTTGSFEMIFLFRSPPLPDP